MSVTPTGTAIQASQSISAVSGQRRLAQWRRRLERRRAVRDLELHVTGAARTYQLAAPADPDAVLDELASPEPHMPYWATPWPSGLALAEVALARRARLGGRRVLELGCGLGTTAIALAECGSNPIGVDCFTEALAYARYNVARNTGRTLRTLLLDWRTEAGVRRLASEAADIVLAADVLYESEDIGPLLELGEHVLGRGSELWLAEPGRATSQRFIECALDAGWNSEELVIQREWPAVVGSASVRVHLFTPAPAAVCERAPMAH